MLQYRYRDRLTTVVVVNNPMSGRCLWKVHENVLQLHVTTCGGHSWSHSNLLLLEHLLLLLLLLVFNMLLRRYVHLPIVLKSEKNFLTFQYILHAASDKETLFLHCPPFLPEVRYIQVYSAQIAQTIQLKTKNVYLIKPVMKSLYGGRGWHHWRHVGWLRFR